MIQYTVKRKRETFLSHTQMLLASTHEQSATTNNKHVQMVGLLTC